MRFLGRWITCAVLAGALHVAAQTAAAPSWKRLEFLMGRWSGAGGEKDGNLGSGQGTFSFEPQVKERIVVRRNHSAYESGAQHDDFMVIYFEGPGDTPRAIYFDSEGHVIRYNTSFPAANRVVFESDGTQPGPKYRLTYWLEGRQLNGTFEIAPPGASYKTYLNWTSKKVDG